jgi:peptide/nickel transport system substrate-binding protein
LSAEIRRRTFLGAAAALALARGSLARGRLPVGGRITVSLPWPTASVDPHRVDDATAAILHDALFDTLYARDEAGVYAPSLAEGDPEPDGASLRVTLRSGLKTAAGRPLEPRDVAASLARARSSGARVWLADVPAPRIDGRALVFATRDVARLVRALASPLVAIVPASFNPESPDGTGPFRLVRRTDATALVRNTLAARGPALLDEIVLRFAATPSDSLRSFESGAADLGWLGQGLYEPRPGSRPFDFGAVAWAILRVGKDAGSWDAPGVAQGVCDGLPASRLASFALGPSWPTEPDQGWGGPATPLLVRDDSPWLMELARALAAIISRQGHEVTAKPVPASEIAQKRGARAYGLMLDVARPAAPGALGALVGLSTADDPGASMDLMRRPPKLADSPVRTLTRTLHVGVVGDIRVQGGRVPDVTLVPSHAAFGTDLGGATRARR